MGDCPSEELSWWGIVGSVLVGNCPSGQLSWLGIVEWTGGFADIRIYPYFCHTDNTIIFKVLLNEFIRIVVIQIIPSFLCLLFHVEIPLNEYC